MTSIEGPRPTDKDVERLVAKVKGFGEWFVDCDPSKEVHVSQPPVGDGITDDTAAIQAMIDGRYLGRVSAEKRKRIFELVKSVFDLYDSHAERLAREAEKEQVSHIADDLERLEIAEREVAKQLECRDLGCASAHVVIESGCTPGITCQCRCDQCKLVAQKMDEAGYMEGVKDRWWADALVQMKGGE